MGEELKKGREKKKRIILIKLLFLCMLFTLEKEQHHYNIFSTSQSE